MQDFMNHLIEKAVANSVSLKVAKLQIKSEWHPDIVISRDPGSGGHPVAKKIAKKLGWVLLDETLMNQLAEKLGIPTAEFASVDEHGRSWLTDSIQAIFNPDYVSDVRYITNLKKVLLQASKQGDLVIVGRGANLILPPDKCLSVRITASFDTRVSNTLKYENKKNKEDATAWVRHVQRNRNDFIRQYFGSNPHNPWNYDLVISTDNLSLDQVVEIVLNAYKVKFPKEAKRLKSKLS